MWEEDKNKINILQQLHLIRSCFLCSNTHIIPFPSFSKYNYQYSLDLTIIFSHLESLHWSHYFVADCRILLSSSESLIDNLNFSLLSQVPSLLYFFYGWKTSFYARYWPGWTISSSVSLKNVLFVGSCSRKTRHKEEQMRDSVLTLVVPLLFEKWKFFGKIFGSVTCHILRTIQILIK